MNFNFASGGRSFICLLLVAVAGAGCGSGSDPSTQAEIVAQQGDFAEFRTWKTLYLGDRALPGHPPGPRYGYVKPPGACGATGYPVGSILVKAVQPPDQPVQLFAMAKRGGSYNPSGAKGWEFFVLRLDQNDAPVILGRGIDPANPDNPDAGGYFAGLTCNVCHAISGAEKTDHVLSPMLAPGLCP